MLALVIAVAAFFHGAIMATRPVVLDGDATSYIGPATALVRLHQFRGPNPVTDRFVHPLNARPPGPETVRTPGYPLFLAAILVLGLPLQTAAVIQHLLGVALAAAVFLFVDKILHRRTAAAIAGILIGTQPAIVATANQYMTDLLCVAVVAAAMFCTFRVLRGGPARWAVAAGLLTGCATLIRPIAIFWFVPLAIVIATRAPRRAAVFALAAILLPAAWIGRNYAETGVATISSIAGENMLFFRAAPALVIRDKPLAFQLFAIQQPWGVIVPQQKLQPRLAEMALAEARRDGVDPRRAPHALLSRYYARLGARIVLQHIPQAAALAFSALVEMFVFTYARTASAWIAGGSPLLWLTLALTVAIAAAAGIGLAVLRRVDAALAALLAVTIAYFALMAAGFEGDIRFAIQFAPAYAIAAGIGLEHLIQRGAS